MRTHEGFTVTELLVVLMLAGIAGGIVVPSIGRSLAETRLQRAASVIAVDMQLAQSLAARQRSPVEISIDPTAQTMRVRDLATPTKVYSFRDFGMAGEYPVQTLTVTEGTTEVTVYPNGLAARALTVELRSGGRKRRIAMTRAGQVRVSAP